MTIASGVRAVSSLDRVTFPRVSMRVARDHDELAAVEVELGVEAAARVEAADLGIWHRPPGTTRPGAATGDRRPCRPRARARRRAADARAGRHPRAAAHVARRSRPASRSTVGGSSRSDAHDREPTDPRRRVGQTLLGEPPGADRCDEGVADDARPARRTGRGPGRARRHRRAIARTAPSSTPTPR